MTFREPHWCKEMGTHGTLWPHCHYQPCQHITIRHPSTQDLEGASHCLPAQLRGAVLTARQCPHSQDSSQLHQAGWVLANLHRLAARSISAIGTGLMKCQSAALPIDPCSSLLHMSYCLCILPEIIKRRKQPSVLPGCPKGDTLLGREREKQFKASRWQQGGLSLGQTAETGKKCQKTLQAALQPDLTWSRKSIINNNMQH